MASMVFRRVDSKRSLRFSRRETLSCVMPGFYAIRICVSLRACRSSRKVISSATNCATRASTGSLPRIVAADAGFYSQANEKRLEEMGVKNVSVPNRNTRSEQRRSHQTKRSFKEGQRWRTGCEGRIRVLKRRHGLKVVATGARTACGDGLAWA
jgi:IS5 family transposase